MKFPRFIRRRPIRRLLWVPAKKYNGPYLWSRGISQFCDFKGPASYWREETESCQSESFFNKHYAGANGVVWVRLGTQSRHGKPCDLNNFVRGALPTIQEPFVLITTDGDASVPSEIAPDTVNALLECPWLISWYTQNFDGNAHAKIRPFPIGLDFHTPRYFSSTGRLVAEFEAIRDSRQPLDQVPLRVFCDSRVKINSGERSKVVAALQECNHVDFLKKRVPQIEIWRRYTEYPFVISTVGNGLDCHRTWELLYLGTIVITKTSSLDDLYDGLPVVIVKDWSEVGDKENLTKWLQQYGRLTDQKNIMSHLDSGRLISLIRENLNDS